MYRAENDVSLLIPSYYASFYDSGCCKKKDVIATARTQIISEGEDIWSY